MVHKKTYLTEVRPLGFFLKVLGWLPTSRVDTSLGLSLELRIFSVDFIYASIVIALQMTVAICMMLDGIKIISNIPSHLHIISCYFLIYKIVPLFLPFLTALQVRTQINFVEKWLDVQHEIETVGISGCYYNFGNLRRNLLIKILIIIALCITALTLRTIRLQRFALEDVLLILGFFNEAIMFMWYYYTAHAFTLLSDRLLQEYQLLLEYNEAGRSGDFLAKAVLHLRSPSLKLNSIRRESASSVAIAQGLLFVYNFTRLLFTAYLATTVMDLRILGMCGLVFFISVFELYSTCNVSHEIRKKWHEGTLKALACTKKLRICNATKDMMTGFLLHLIQNNPEVSFSGYINVGRRLLSTLFSAFITYVAVVFQFKEYEKGYVTFEEVINLNDYFFSNMTKNSIE